MQLHHSPYKNADSRQQAYCYRETKCICVVMKAPVSLVSEQHGQIVLIRQIPNRWVYLFSLIWVTRTRPLTVRVDAVLGLFTS